MCAYSDDYGNISAAQSSKYSYYNLIVEPYFFVMSPLVIIRKLAYLCKWFENKAQIQRKYLLEINWCVYLCHFLSSTGEGLPKIVHFSFSDLFSDPCSLQFFNSNYQFICYPNEYYLVLE